MKTKLKALSILLCLHAAHVPAAETSKLVFDVFLDDSRIGFHEYEFVSDGDETRVSSEAKFDVKFLFFTAYKYRHNVTELWNSGCLRAIEATTNTNGKLQTVSGDYESGDFIVATGDVEQSTRIEECVMSFAYWNADFLEQSRLLNPQTGEYLEVDVRSLDENEIELSGKQLGASAYRLEAKDMEVTVWYSADGTWVGLESRAKGGRILRYEIA